MSHGIIDPEFDSRILTCHRIFFLSINEMTRTSLAHSREKKMTLEF